MVQRNSLIWLLDMWQYIDATIIATRYKKQNFFSSWSHVFSFQPGAKIPEPWENSSWEPAYLEPCFAKHHNP